MKIIYKYPLSTKEDNFDVSMPQGATILSIQYQYSVLILWAIVDPDAVMETRHLVVVGTGGRLKKWGLNHKHLATVQEPGSGDVWHIFEVTPV